MCYASWIGHFRITFGLFFKASLDAHLFIWKLVFICMWMKANFHMKRWAPGLALKKRPKVIRKWPIGKFLEWQFKRALSRHFCAVFWPKLTSLSHFFLSLKIRTKTWINLLQSWFCPKDGEENIIRKETSGMNSGLMVTTGLQRAPLE